jgi:hypothetical protein
MYTEFNPEDLFNAFFGGGMGMGGGRGGMGAGPFGGGNGEYMLFSPCIIISFKS